MKTIIIILFILSSSFGAIIETAFEVKGMTCAAGCAPKVKNAAMSLNGVKRCEVDFEKSKATITFDNKKVTEAQILSTLKKTTAFKYNIEEPSIGSSEKNKKETPKSFFKKILELI